MARLKRLWLKEDTGLGRRLRRGSAAVFLNSAKEYIYIIFHVVSRIATCEANNFNDVEAFENIMFKYFGIKNLVPFLLIMMYKVDREDKIGI